MAGCDEKLISATTTNNFHLVGTIDKGSFGKVVLGRSDNEVSAMKVLRTENVMNRNQVEHSDSERNVLEVVSHPFIVQSHDALQNLSKLHFVLECCPGCD